jgi:BirA family biotin operon repressor/biotin-[acetyl-CoA-carboxylase] ligase
VLPPDIVDTVLRLEGLGLVRQVDWFAALGSTNDQALTLADDDAVELPRLVWTGRQTAGRGRGANKWWSAAGALTFSLIVDADALGVPADRRPPLALVAGLAVVEALAPFAGGTPLGLKWPNDVWLAEKKIAGILVETARRRNERLVIGIGLNVGNSFRDAPPEVRQIATSVADESSLPVAPPAVLLGVLTAWTRLVTEFAAGDLPLAAAWRRHCVLTGRVVRLTAGPQIVEGRCAGIDDDGAILIDTVRGRDRHIAGTVRRLVQ